jgi:competence protein ComFA
MKESLTAMSGESSILVPAIQNGVCQRCLSKVDETDLDDQFRRYCKGCEAYGRVGEGMMLYRYPRILTLKNHLIQWPFPLSKAQRVASAYLIETLKSHQSGFLHAVCGAGKTEILYESLLWGLNQGFRICLAIPRTDIVRELTGRLKPIFPNTIIKCLHRDEKDDSDADIVVSTIQQLIRYHQEFDLLFLDEADAFPYKGNPFLHQLVKKALKDEGIIVRMSATVDKIERRSLRMEKIPTYILPARHHRHGLDRLSVTYIIDLSRCQRVYKVPEAVGLWLSKHAEVGKQVLLFVPTIPFGVWLENVLKLAGFVCLNVSSVDDRRNDKIMAFRAGRIPILISTTLLERGITVSDIDVGILHASHAVFDEHTLIQMAGRVGRDKRHPTGEIMIFTERMTSAIRNAQKYIRIMNIKARKSDLIDHDL